MRSAVSGRTQSSSASSSSRPSAASAAWMRAFASSLSAMPSSCEAEQADQAGSVRPCSTSVAMITQNVMKMMNERCGKGSPLSIVSGSARAAASETAPRRPAQPISVGCCHGGRDRARGCARPARGRTGRIDPHEARHDHRPGDDRAVGEQRAGRAALQRVEDRAQLQPDKAEEDGVEQEREDLPDRVALEPRCNVVSSGVYQPT